MLLDLVHCNIQSFHEKSDSFCSEAGNCYAEQIEPGLLVLRNFVSDEDCEQMATMAMEMGEQGEDGFFTNNQKGEKVLNTGAGEGRGRIYDNANRFPPSLIEKCDAAVKRARSCDTAMPNMKCTHLLLNMYTTSKGLVWHRDIYENDGRSDHPVVNLCVGASCVFGFKHNDDDDERSIVLRSGDVLLFGGPCRLIKHAVLKILLDDCPMWMKNKTTPPCRFSFTFRDSPEVIGREEEFKYFRVSEHLVGQEDFQVPMDPKLFRGLPSSTTQRVSFVSEEPLVSIDEIEQVAEVDLGDHDNSCNPKS